MPYVRASNRMNGNSMLGELIVAVISIESIFADPDHFPHSNIPEFKERHFPFQSVKDDALKITISFNPAECLSVWMNPNHVRHVH